jgi:hypothetical protein
MFGSEERLSHLIELRLKRGAKKKKIDERIWDCLFSRP